MKNPFALMAVMAAAMTAAYRENAYRDAGVPLPTGRGRTRIAGKKHAAGTKLLMRFYKAHHGEKASSVEEARQWYTNYLHDLDVKAVKRDAEKRAQRALRRDYPPMKVAA